MRLLIIGNSGSGNSYRAKALAAQHDLAHLDLDTIVWEPGQIAVPRAPQQVQADLLAFVHAHGSWVAEGCYGDLVEAALPWCSELVFMNPGREIYLENNRRRPWEPHKYDSMEAQQSKLPFLLDWVAGYYERDDAMSYACHRHLFDRFDGNKTEVTAL
ncbi:shikimate kinase [Massilia sp. Dwa41.01b]|uniref:shikimate kinase n=1 Tax=unclassified Massilia TaxID=2609279 RepID=UPI0016012656|nr:MULTISPECIES: shikimate kinase [unclassified Massilia]QNA87431.1 shikimate kinase [Massilia sp. Dwa41.01b]QNA98339.1 shikimate kinase [Massilia sp. Se16.2.3]